MVSVKHKPRSEDVAQTLRSKRGTYQDFLAVFARWQTEKGKKFDDWYKEETRGFALGTLQVIKKFEERRKQLPEKYLRGEELDLNDVIPPASYELLEGMLRIAYKNNLKDKQTALPKIGEYLFSRHIEKVPAVRIGSLLYAAVADQAANGGRKNPPSEGVTTDVNMIETFLPYCDAIFVDKENAVLLSDSRVTQKLDCQTKVFSLRNRQSFLDYLDGLLAAATSEHLAFVEQVYGSNWKQPYLSILEHKD